MKKEFEPYRPQAKARALIDKCNAILSTLYDQGFVLTLRQLFYQLVVRQVIPNTAKDYDTLGDVLVAARYGGLVDWEHLQDRVRVLQTWLRFKDAKERLKSASETMLIDLWEGQVYRPEVWIEKDALIELAETACRPWGVDYIAIKAYNSTSAIWEAYKRFKEYLENGQIPLILHLGDFDYTGDDCSRFLAKTMQMVLQDVEGEIAFRRLALNPSQIDHYNLPPQFGKMKDPRFKAHIKRHGEWLRKFARTHEEWVEPLIAEQRKEHGKRDNDDIALVWELDALDPKVLIALIEDGIEQFLVLPEVRRKRMDEQEGYRSVIVNCAENYDLIATDHFKTWIALQDCENTAVTDYWGIPQFSQDRNRIPLSEMDADTAEEFYRALNQ